MPTCYVVVSADNSPYIAWQAMLLHHSCLTRVGAAPLVVVHGAGDRPLHPGYDAIAAAGGLVARAPSFRRAAASGAAGAGYAPRNTPGTLLAAADLSDDPDAAFVLCDPDMLFVRRPAFAPRLSGDFYDYLDYSTPAVAAAARRLGVSPADLADRGETIRCGVPHVVPAAIARPFAETWLDAIDAFPERGYVDSMYAFGIAAAALGLEVAATRHMITNHEPDAPLDADMVHYCYGDDRWSKRHFLGAADAARVWDAPAPDAADRTVRAEVARQLAEAARFYDCSASSRA